MIFLIEDKVDDMLSRLFKAAYRCEIAERFIYTNGNGNLHKVAERELKETSEEIVAYLDTVPGNDDIRKIYHKLASLSRNHQNRLLVLPIVCIEYYFIKSIQGTHLVIDAAELERCINREPYFDSALISSTVDKKYCTNFERYCKLELRKNVIDCTKNSSCLDLYGKTPNAQYGEYCTRDCLCVHPVHGCGDKRLIDKSLDLLKQYPCVPAGTQTDLARLLSKEQLYSIHKKLVDDFNELVLKFRSMDTENANHYKTISYMVNS